MSTIETHRKDNTLIVEIKGAFNLREKNMIESRLRPGVTILDIDLKNTSLIDSEAIIFMHKWQEAGHKLILKDPPDVLFEILGILELREVWDLDNIITN